MSLDDAPVVDWGGPEPVQKPSSKARPLPASPSDYQIPKTALLAPLKSIPLPDEPKEPNPISEPQTVEDSVESNQMRKHRRKVWLKPNHAETIIELARDSLRDRAILLLVRWGLRIGEVVGCKAKTVYWRWKDPKNHALGREQAVSIVDLPGLYVANVRETSVWVKGKGYAAGRVEEKEIPLAPEAMEALRTYISYAHVTGKIFDLTEQHFNRLLKDYAQRAGMADWQNLSSHRFRAYFATDAKKKLKDPFLIRDLMRHKNIKTTEIYIGHADDEELAEGIRKLSEKES